MLALSILEGCQILRALKLSKTLKEIAAQSSHTNRKPKYVPDVYTK